MLQLVSGISSLCLFVNLILTPVPPFPTCSATSTIVYRIRWWTVEVTAQEALFAQSLYSILRVLRIVTRVITKVKLYSSLLQLVSIFHQSNKAYTAGIDKSIKVTQLHVDFE